ncbi:type II toxin-antitoxin system RelE/ParE family toxin [Planctellipticum variicoloris]|uniref:type II toxin-antitoxin system RelE/ParE family toxin n=1 Tax=Planctellipticum variicoloris TaxID=3064265 RepID=UPI00301373FC|nr:type II toxin-antitoxin system RelE/ParE family toxin [Planctomycetaceae bacterium SH412]
MNASVELTERTLVDLREIERYSVEKWGRTTANQYLDDIAAAFDRFIENPEILSLEPDFAPGLYFYRVRKHVLVCDYHERKVVVLTIFHTSMDLPARLAELEPRLIVEAQILRSKLNR